MSRVISSTACVEIFEGIINASKSRGIKPVAISICDPSGIELASLRLDGCPPASFPSFAKAKAKTAVALGCSSREFKARYEEMKPWQMMFMAQSQGLAPFPGGIVVKSATDGEVIGSVGVSGASSDEDEYLAISGVRSASSLVDITTEPAEHKLND